MLPASDFIVITMVGTFNGLHHRVEAVQDGRPSPPEVCVGPRVHYDSPAVRIGHGPLFGHVRSLSARSGSVATVLANADVNFAAVSVAGRAWR